MDIEADLADENLKLHLSKFLKNVESPLSSDKSSVTIEPPDEEKTFKETTEINDISQATMAQ